MSALEHAIPERFFNDPAKCNPSGTTTPVSGLPDCPQGVSAVKALATAAAQGQKIYTITRQIYQNNPGIVSSNLYSLSANTRRDIQNALDAGYEVTVHEAPITLSGWTGAGYTFIDPETGAGGYIIDGGSNGNFLKWWEDNGTYVGLAVTTASWVAAFANVGPVIVVALALLSIFVAVMNIMIIDLQTIENGCPSNLSQFGGAIEFSALVASFFGKYGVAFGSLLSFLTGSAIGSAVKACRR